MSANAIRDLAAKDRLIIALDFDNEKDALQLVDELQGVVSFFKVGYELFLSAGWQVIDQLSKRGVRVFLDLKMDDVAATITKAVHHVVDRKSVDFLTIHGNGATADAAKIGKGNSNLKILQITLLTSLDENSLLDLQLLGSNPEKYQFNDLSEYVKNRARNSIEHGCDGVIASGQNAEMLRKEFGNEFILVCPGIRPEGDSVDDQARHCTPYQAIVHGADYLVVGRPIRNAPDSKAKAQSVVDEIERALQDRA